MNPSARAVLPIVNERARRSSPARTWLATGMLLLLAATPALARHHSHSREQGVAGEFDYYLLSLSWSPTYCLTHAQDRAQCTRGFGFVLHGLWPQFETGGFPESCASEAPLSAEAQAAGMRIYPSPRLMQHEWQRHGTCSGLDALAYFLTADRALAAVKVPPQLEAPSVTRALPVEQIVAAFRASNPALAATGITVACTRDELSEVRVCMTRDLALRPCGRGVRNACPRVPIEIRSAR